MIDPSSDLPVESVDQSPDTGQRGFALIAVIWIAGLLAVMASSFAITSRSTALVAAHSAQNLRAEYIADGIVRLSALRLADWMDGVPSYPLNGDLRACRWGEEVEVWISVQDQGGLIDLNTASPTLLKRMLETLLMPPADVLALVARIRDFRDPDGVNDSLLPEKVDYAGLSWEPKNEPFAVPEELDQIPGLSFQQYRQLRKWVTVQSQQPGFDPAVAPQDLLAALGLAAEGDQDALAFTSPSPGRVFGIEAAVRLRNGSSYVRETVVSMLRQPERPFATLSWQHGLEFPATLPPAVDPCLN